MTEQKRPTGLPLRLAITTLASPERRELADQYLTLQARGHKDLDAHMRILWLDIAEQLQSRELVARGFRSAATEAATISHEFFNSATADYNADAVESHGVTYHGVRVFAAAEAPADNVPLAPAVSAQEIALSTKKSPAGAPRKYDDQFIDHFVREIVRLALTPDGFETKRQLKKHMVDWCSKSFPDGPDDRTIGRFIDRFCPPEIAAK